MDAKKLSKKPEPETNEDGHPTITKKYLKSICEYSGGYSTPEHNETVYLNSKGFRKMENLEEYISCKVLFMDGNVFRQIENICHMTNLRTLFLHDNLITKMIDFSAFKLLDTLNLANNRIEVIEGLEKCNALSKIDLTSNKLTSLKSLDGLKDKLSIRTLLLKNNQINYDPKIIAFFKENMSIGLLELQGNPFYSEQRPSEYRRNLITQLDTLNYLDDKGISPQEREMAHAFIKGGKKEEDAVVHGMNLEKEASSKNYLQNVKNKRELAMQKWREEKERERLHGIVVAQIEPCSDEEAVLEGCYAGLLKVQEFRLRYK